jgi:hypothetical protein
MLPGSCIVPEPVTLTLPLLLFVKTLDVQPLYCLELLTEYDAVPDLDPSPVIDHEPDAEIEPEISSLLSSSCEPARPSISTLLLAVLYWALSVIDDMDKVALAGSIEEQAPLPDADALVEDP